MPLQFTCPFCQAKQQIPDQASGQAFACAKCKKVVKIAAPPPLARPVAQPISTSFVRSRKQGNSSMAAYILIAITVVTMGTGVTLAILYWPGRETPLPTVVKVVPPLPPSNGKPDVKPGPVKKFEEPPEPEPEPDAEPPLPLVSHKMGEWYLDGADPKVRFEFQTLDATTKIKELKVIVWTGSVAAPKPPTWRARPVRRGDSARREIAVEFKDGRGTVDVPLPALPKDKVYWLQAVLVDDKDKSQWLALEPWEPAAAPLERRPARLTHRTEGGARLVQVSSQAAVTVRNNMNQPFLFNIGVQAELDETIKGTPAELHHQYTRVRFEFIQDGIPAFVEKFLGGALDATSKIKTHWQLDASGTVGKRIVNLDDVPENVRKDVPQFDERLAQAFDLLSLYLPNREVQALESWKQSRPWGKATLDLTATYEGRRMHEKRDEAYVSLHGALKETGNDKAGKVTGMALIDLKNGFVMKAELKVETAIIVPFIGPGVIQAPGSLDVRLSREVK